jgi:hypothetical protein
LLLSLSTLLDDTLDLMQKSSRGWAINRLAAGVREADSPLIIHDEISPQLMEVPPAGVKAMATRDLPGIVPERARRPGAADGPLQTVGPVDVLLRIEQQREGHPRLAKPGPRVGLSLKREKQYLSSQRAECSFMMAQLRHMLAAGQSAEVAQEDQEHHLASPVVLPK